MEGPLPLMLADCRVLDFTQYLAGPTVTRLMAEWERGSLKLSRLRWAILRACCRF